MKRAGTSEAMPSLWLLRILGFLSFFDRFGTAPMLVVLAPEIGVDLGAAVQLVAVYSLAYALGQPLWGLLSDRIGRATVLKISLAGTVLASAASLAIPGFPALLIARAVTGFSVGALYPTILTMFGDNLRGPARPREISQLQTVSALGTTVATLIAGAIAVWLNWRVMFVITLIGAALVLALIVRTRYVEAERPPRSLRAAFRPWAIVLYLLAFLEGTALLGALTYIAPAMEKGGMAVDLAGLLAAAYGIGIIVGSQVMTRLVMRYSRPVLMAVGGGVLTAAYVVATLWPTSGLLALTAAMIGLGHSFLQSSVQSWATEVTPEARATSISIFATSLFLGAGAATAVTAGLANDAQYRVIFFATAIVSAVVTLVAAIGYRRWSESREEGSAA